MSRIDFLHSALVVQDDHMGGESVSHMALRVRHVRPQLVCGIKELSKVFLPLQFLQVAAGLLQIPVQIR